MKKTALILLFFSTLWLQAQELYPLSEPASNMPAKSVSLKFGAVFGKGNLSNRFMIRQTPELMLGINKKWMVHGSISISNMQESSLYFESIRIYSKYRFLSIDEVHKHFRMAAFAAVSYSRNHLDFNEINLAGDQSGVQSGIIVTQLWNKFALSGTLGIAEVIDKKRNDKLLPKQYAFEALNFSLSGGYLLFPKSYTNYDQTNINLYAEILGGRNLDWTYEKNFIDLAPSIQFIFKSTSKLNIGYRFQLKSDIVRPAINSFIISYEYLFLNSLRKKK